MSEQIVDISQAQRKSPLPSGHERELLNARVRELEEAHR